MLTYVSASLYVSVPSCMHVIHLKGTALSIPYLPMAPSSAMTSECPHIQYQHIQSQSGLLQTQPQYHPSQLHVSRLAQPNGHMCLDDDASTCVSSHDAHQGHTRGKMTGLAMSHTQIGSIATTNQDVGGGSSSPNHERSDSSLLTAADSQRRVAPPRVTGPAFCKMLMPNHLAGAIIGKNGKTIADIESRTNCELQVSGAKDFFPGTNDRIVIMSGEWKGVEECIRLVLGKLYGVSQQSNDRQPDRSLLTKMAVPSSAVNMIIGRKGEVIKKFQMATNCKVNVSRRAEGFEFYERILLIAGEYNNLVNAAVLLCRDIQGDPHLKEHMHLQYDIELPMSVWSEDKAGVADPATHLIHPKHAASYSKKELIAYLHKVESVDVENKPHPPDSGLSKKNLSSEHV